MNRRKQVKQSNTLLRKVIILIVLVILLVVLVIFQDYRRKKGQAEYEQLLEEQQEADVPESGTQEDGAGEPGSEGDESREETLGDMSANDAGNQVMSIPILNLEELAVPVMGENGHLLQERLAGWIEENHLAADSGTILNVVVPDSDPESIQFYVRLNDSIGSMVVLSYHAREGVVTASDCEYTEEEIVSEVWEDNGPAQRDVSPEEEAAMQNQETVVGETESEGTQ